MGIDITGVFDVRMDAALSLAAQFNSVVLDDMSAYENAVKKADMVHLCTPPSLRLNYLEIAAEAGCHIILEKPMAIEMIDAEKMIDIAKKNNVQIMVDYNHRFRRGFNELIKVVKSGKLGEIISIFFYRIGMLGGNAGTKNDTWRRVPGMVCGMSIESLSHDIDMIMQLDGEIKDVKADIRGTFADVPEFDTNAQISFNMKNNSMAMLYSSWSSHIKESKRGLIGTKGTVFLEGNDLFDFECLRLKTEEMEFEEVGKINDIYNLQTCSSYTTANQHFLDIIQCKCNNTVSGEHALSTLKVSHAILQSAKEQRIVSLS